MNRSLSLEFSFDEYFREIVRSAILRDMQLSLNLSDRDNVSDVSALGGINSLNISWCLKVTDVCECSWWCLYSEFIWM